MYIVYLALSRYLSVVFIQLKYQYTQRLTMKVAITIAGLPRFTREFDDFLEKLKDYDQVDWFFYLWNRLDDPFVPPNWPATDVDAIRAKIVSNLPANHNIAYLAVHEMPEYIVTRPLNTTPWTSLPGVWYMYYGLKLVNEQREQYELHNGKYDLVIRSRGDISVTHEISCRAAAHYLQQNPSSILMPADHRMGLQGRVVCEAFGIGTSEIMSIYARLFDRLFEYNDNGCMYHPETLTAHHLTVNNIHTPMTNFGFVFRNYNRPDWVLDWGRWN